MKKAILIVGTSMHGKSTLAEEVVNKNRNSNKTMGRTYCLDVDKERLKEFPDWKKEATNDDGTHNFPTDIHYLTLATDRMFRRFAEDVMADFVVVAGTFSQPGPRRVVYDFSNNPNWDVRIVRLAGLLTPEQVEERIKERKARGDDSPMQSYEMYLKSCEFQDSAWEGEQLSPWDKAVSVDMNKFDGKIQETVDEIMRLTEC